MDGSREREHGTTEPNMSVVRARERSLEGSERTDAPASPTAEAQPIDLGALFDAYAPFLVRVITRVVGASDRAEDIVQRAFLTAHRKGLPSSEPDAARAWLYRVAMNEVRHERRSWARRARLSARLIEEPTLAPTDPHDLVEASRQSAAVRSTLARLPPKQREVFALYELEELSGSEIAALVGVPENTVWSRLRLARERFRKLWALREEKR